jgi:hypothetical protein
MAARLNWVNLDRNGLSARCPVYSHERPNCGHRCWSGSCQKATCLQRHGRKGSAEPVLGLAEDNARGLHSG